MKWVIQFNTTQYNTTEGIGRVGKFKKLTILFFYIARNNVLDE